MNDIKETDIIFEESLKIIDANKLKASALRNIFSNSKILISNNSNFQIIQFLGELEYDLKTLIELLKDYKNKISLNFTENKNIYEKNISSLKDDIVNINKENSFLKKLVDSYKTKLFKIKNKSKDKNFITKFNTNKKYIHNFRNNFPLKNYKTNYNNEKIILLEENKQDKINNMEYNIESEFKTCDNSNSNLIKYDNFIKRCINKQKNNPKVGIKNYLFNNSFRNKMSNSDYLAEYEKSKGGEKIKNLKSDTFNQRIKLKIPKRYSLIKGGGGTNMSDFIIKQTI